MPFKKYEDDRFDNELYTFFGNEESEEAVKQESENDGIAENHFPEKSLDEGKEYKKLKMKE